MNTSSEMPIGGRRNQILEQTQSHHQQHQHQQITISKNARSIHSSSLSTCNECHICQSPAANLLLIVQSSIRHTAPLARCAQDPWSTNPRNALLSYFNPTKSVQRRNINNTSSIKNTRTIYLDQKLRIAGNLLIQCFLYCITIL